MGKKKNKKPADNKQPEPPKIEETKTEAESIPVEEPLSAVAAPEPLTTDNTIESSPVEQIVQEEKPETVEDSLQEEEEEAPAEGDKGGMFGTIRSFGGGLMDGVKDGLDKGMRMVPDAPAMSKEVEEAAPGEPKKESEKPKKCDFGSIECGDDEIESTLSQSTKVPPVALFYSIESII